jgi:hypothetical protein
VVFGAIEPGIGQAAKMGDQALRGGRT